VPERKFLLSSQKDYSEHSTPARPSGCRPDDHGKGCDNRKPEAVFKLMYLGLKNISQRWTMPIKNWSGAMNQFAILFEGRVPMGGLSSNSLTQNRRLIL
jgi:hypothetical protein